MADLVGHLGAVDRASLFDSLERAATRVGLALFVVHIDAAPPVVLYGSELLAEFVGRPVKDLVGRPPWELVAPSQQARVRETIASRGPGAQPITMQFEIERPDGTRREIEVGVARITTSGAELAVCYFRDNTDERAVGTALRRSEARFRSLIENAPDGVVILQQGRFVLANPAAVRMFAVPDFEAVRGRQLIDFLPPSEAARAAERITQLYAGMPGQSAEYRLIPNNLVVEVHSVLCEYDDKPAILSFVRDVTERRRMQEQLFRGDRLAALGTMCATVAHEINNPLTYLQLNLQRLEGAAATEQDPARAAMLREHVASALHGVHRVAKIVRDLQAHSRDINDEPETPVDVVSVVERVLQMVEHDLRHRAQLVRRYATEPAIIDGSAGRLEQVMLNLLLNAIQALDGSEPAANQITIEIEIGDDVTIAVSDTGPGIRDPDRVFEPFFTTKPIGEGTGLGLSVCKQLVDHMRGRIEIVRTNKHGTKLAIALPRRRAPVPQRAPVAEQVSGDRLRVLVIDDEPHVLDAMKDLLESEHHVDTVGDGESALVAIAAAEYDVILCDLMMPRMNGRDVYERIRAHRAGLERRLVFVTGGAFVPALASFLESVDNLKLRKPFTLEHVLALVQEARRRTQGSAMPKDSPS
ncbi:MAG TPA: PAS domain S-box protein [Kofleriaceae bacterium]|nr:PAS domain S-box protein [Kofleriaceae bacterium]